MKKDKVQLALSRDEAIVLYEWIARFNETGSADFQDQAEQRVLWDIEAMLESVLVEPLAPNFEEALAKAREKGVTRHERGDGAEVEVCERYGAEVFETPARLKVGIARSVREGFLPLNGLRHPPRGDTTGRYIWASEISDRRR